MIHTVVIVAPLQEFLEGLVGCRESDILMKNEIPQSEQSKIVACFLGIFRLAKLSACRG